MLKFEIKLGTILLDSEETREAVKLVHQHVGHLLYPNTPITLEADGPYIHVSCEGEWRGMEGTAENAIAYVRETHKACHDDWAPPTSRMVPKWEGWKAVDKHARS